MLQTKSKKVLWAITFKLFPIANMLIMIRKVFKNYKHIIAKL